MQPVASDRIVLAGLAALALVSIGIKAVAGPPRDGLADNHRVEIASQFRDTLSRQGFSVSERTLQMQSSIVFGQRGTCRLSVRDARGGKPMMTQFARDAAAIGPVRYLYMGRSYDAPPGLRIRLARLETEMLGRIGIQAKAHVAVALAASPGCGQGDFGLGNISLAV